MLCGKVGEMDLDPQLYVLKGKVDFLAYFGTLGQKLLIYSKLKGKHVEKRWYGKLTIQASSLINL